MNRLLPLALAAAIAFWASSASAEGVIESVAAREWISYLGFAAAAVGLLLILRDKWLR